MSVCRCSHKLQVAILARSSREMSQTVRIVWQYILSRVLVSVWPSNFVICEKHPKPRRNRVACASVYLNEAATGHWSPAEPAKRGVTPSQLGATDPLNSDNLDGSVCVCVRACVHDVFAIYDNNIWPRLMIIINIISYKSHTLMISPQRVTG